MLLRAESVRWARGADADAGSVGGDGCGSDLSDGRAGIQDGLDIYPEDDYSAESGVGGDSEDVVEPEIVLAIGWSKGTTEDTEDTEGLCKRHGPGDNRGLPTTKRDGYSVEGKIVRKWGFGIVGADSAGSVLLEQGSVAVSEGELYAVGADEEHA